MSDSLVTKTISSQKIVVLVVEDDLISATISTQALADSYDAHHVSDGQAAVDFCESTPPDLVLMDINMPGMSGLEAYDVLKKNVITKDIPVIFITAASDPQSEDECWDAGCVDFISKPFSVKTLRHRINAHLSVKILTDELKRLATSDGLTQIHNRRFFDTYFLEQSELAARNKTPLGLLMIDIDYFKQYNDTYGHLKGDDCLKVVAAAPSSATKRPTDCVARYGGEEFVVVLPNTDAKGVQYVGEHLVEVIRELNLTHAGSTFKKLTISIGGAIVEQGSRETEKVIEQADKKLYAAKQNGRDQFLMA
ncbi:diguanylate cyclase [uncultured Paraglaciecola sp.]|uniref:GGDEF domain-containing response regulator n=1 Tax=uncultured Paraglaciecola sp. TaxID=1765024 RepID=UPI0025FB5344|nr:diguanylate cyclase [uncultured Paraglaciecola sp.]